ncbi:MAG: hypothetical protein RLZZ627_830 [Pseudomonadota bacterium]
MKNVFAYLFGILFGWGLVVARMTDPQRIIAFLEIGPSWSENLIFVMVGALIVTLIAFPLILKQRHPVLDTAFHLPELKRIDLGLVFGALLFGVGWGLSGYCPGPLVVGLVSLKPSPWVCFAFFILGLWVARKLPTTRNRHSE